MNARARMSRTAFLGGSAALALTGTLPARAANLPHVEVINTGAGDSYTLQYLLSHGGYYARAGVDVNTTNVSDGVKLLAAIVNGSADLAVLCGIPQVFPAIANGAPIKLIAGSMLKPDYLLYTANPSIKTLKDLEGKSIGTGAVGALAYVATVAMLLSAGVNISKVTFVNIGSTADVFKAVAAHKVDAGPAQHEFARLAPRYGIRIIADSSTITPKFVYQAAFASENAIKTKRDLLVRTLAAYGAAFRYVDGPTSRDTYVKAYQAATGGEADAGLVKWQWFQKTHAYARNLELPRESVDYIQQLNVMINVQQSVLPFDSITDLSIARDAARMIR
jgi:ABC-type nitrate/sulfonate/bicarbonate transport system substrate-binding protein